MCVCEHLPLKELYIFSVRLLCYFLFINTFLLILCISSLTILKWIPIIIYNNSDGRQAHIAVNGTFHFPLHHICFDQSGCWTNLCASYWKNTPSRRLMHQRIWKGFHSTSCSSVTVEILSHFWKPYLLRLIWILRKSLAFFGFCTNSAAHSIVGRREWDMRVCNMRISQRKPLRCYV